MSWNLTSTNTGVRYFFLDESRFPTFDYNVVSATVLAGLQPRERHDIRASIGSRHKLASPVYITATELAHPEAISHPLQLDQGPLCTKWP